MAVITSGLHLLFWGAFFSFIYLTLSYQVPLRFEQDGIVSGIGDSSFDELVEDVLKQLNVPGLSLAVIDGGVISSKGYGISNFPSTNATADTLYFTASTTKAFTAAAAAALIQDQDSYPNLKWNTPINSLIRDDFVVPSDYSTNHITIQDALSHRSGMPRHDLTYSADDTLKSVTRRMKYLPLTRELRTTFQYCNMMYAVVSHMLESVTGMKIDNLFQEKFWKHLGMLSTSFFPPQSNNSLARGYWYGGSPLQYIPEPYVELSGIGGAGAIVSSVNDYALWVRAWLDASSSNYNNSCPVTRDLHKSLLAPRTIISDFGDELSEPSDSNTFIQPPLYALGWITASVFGYTMVQHGGGIIGFGTQVLFLPDVNYGVVTMGNTAGTSNVAGSIITSILLQQKLGVRIQDRTSFNAALSQALQMPELMDITPHPFSKGSDLRPASHYGVAKSLPLPGHISDYVGMYSHPGYRSINFTLSTSNALLDTTSGPILHGTFVPGRLWNYKIDIRQDTDTLFEAQFFTGHGIDDDNIIWEQVGRSRAVFMFGLPSEQGDTKIEKVGIEIEPEMVLAARDADEDGSRWADGMIWFEKV